MYLRTIFLTALLCLTMFHAKAQQADIRIASLINDEDWFTLSEELPIYKDSIQTGYLRLIADALLAAHTNSTAEAVTMLGELLTKHQEEIGTQSALNFALLRLQLIGEQGRYAEAANGIQRIIEQLESAGVTETQSLNAMYAHYNVLREYTPLSILRPEHDIMVPFRLIEPKVTKREEWMLSGKKSFKGNLMTVPVTIHGKEHPFIFDTGAGATFLFENTAKELGLTILDDTVTVNGSQKGLRAYIDSLQIGEMTIKNMVAYVGFSDAIDTLMSGMDAILGMDIIASIGETQILMDKEQLVFPLHSSQMPQDAKPNLLINGSLLLRTNKDNIPLTFQFDTGCSTAELYNGYYRKFSAEVDLVAEKDTVTTFNYGQIMNSEVLLLPQVKFTINDTPIHIEEVYLYPSSSAYLQQNDGRLGMDLLRQFKKITIDLKHMYLDVK